MCYKIDNHGIPLTSFKLVKNGLDLVGTPAFDANNPHNEYLVAGYTHVSNQKLNFDQVTTGKTLQYVKGHDNY